MRKFSANLQDIKIFRKILKKLIFSNTASPLRQNKTQFFCPYCTWGEPFLRLASLWSTDTRWLGSRQPLRHAARLGAPSTLPEEMLPHCASASSVFPALYGLSKTTKFQGYLIIIIIIIIIIIVLMGYWTCAVAWKNVGKGGARWQSIFWNAVENFSFNLLTWNQGQDVDTGIDYLPYFFFQLFWIVLKAARIFQKFCAIVPHPKFGGALRLKRIGANLAHKKRKHFSSHEHTTTFFKSFNLKKKRKIIKWWKKIISK